MSDGSELIPWLVGPGSVLAWKVGEWAVGRFLRKADTAEVAVAESAAKQMQEVVETTKRVERAVDHLTHAVETQGGVLTSVQSRVEGISENYGKRLHVIEEMQARHDERLKVLERMKVRR